MVIKTYRGCFCKNSGLSVSMRMMRLFVLGLSSCFRAESKRQDGEAWEKRGVGAEEDLNRVKSYFLEYTPKTFVFPILFGMQSPKSACRIYGTCLKKILTMKLMARPAYLEKLIRFIMSGVEMKTTSKQVKIKRLYISIL